MEQQTSSGLRGALQTVYAARGRWQLRYRGGPIASRRATSLTAVTAFFATVLGVATPARAADGCLVMLCLAAPSWKNIPQCVDPVRQVLRDLARGRPFPSCSMSGAGNSANHQWSNPPTFCPPQYTTSWTLDSGTAYQCQFDGAVSVTIEGALWTRTWWNTAGESIAEYTAAAKASLGVWDTRFDDDYAAWLAPLPVASPSCSTC